MFKSIRKFQQDVIITVTYIKELFFSLFFQS